MAEKTDVLAALSQIIDPDFGKDIVSLGFVKNLVIEGGTVKFTIELTTPACPVKEQFRSSAEAAVKALPGVSSVEVTMTAMQAKQRPQGPSIDTLKGVANVIAVSSCKGGVGKSTVAAHLARAIQREGHKVGLLDVDIYGPSLPTLMETRQPEVLMRQQLIQPVAVDGLLTMSLGYMMGDKPAVMRGPMVSNYTMQILKQTDWGVLDYLIIDMPPGTGDIQLTLVQQAALDGAIIVTTPHQLSLVDVARGILMFESVNVPVLGVVENLAWFECDGCSKRHYPFGQHAGTLRERFGVETLAELPILQGLPTAARRNSGENIPEFAALADGLHRAVGMRRLDAEALPKVETSHSAIIITWPDGTRRRAENRALRASCQCALCVNEYTGVKTLDDASIPADIHAEQVQPLGNYALAITWSDGHSSGIFTWEHLKEHSVPLDSVKPGILKSLIGLGN
ncbi:MAG: P-loop NTPase [Candidatus Hydrogenedens sp.]|nr:P-loop NTPase [Candidatus Hydrogenedens sp.]